ncbi:enoyl-CoA hydratase/isomerase family protein [Fodinibius salsisoli]|uniref:Enoyl-CoA hydratase/isomerase family protein n=1 Tax=Fodinibius salsisoli TaxID=2820877 RepID=A0ABT3PPF4_9BACT|nr:enoyl-CoA hydratase-related protein [Fodinibius salsisoli]MCW9707741.1 enoyl-CoA hydratase/isomerase family protein [Fodinibius salsisoli]
MSQPYETIILDTDDQGIATVTINRPKKLNALNTQVLEELSDVFTTIQNDESVLAVIVTGTGDKAFVAGADIKELRALDSPSGKEKSRKGQQVFQQLEDLRKPVVAAVNGYALGGGAELAMACHLRVAGTNAVFGLPEVGLGLIPGYGGTQRLRHIIGQARALELILTTKQIKAEKAYQWGLVNRIAEEDLEEAARSLIHKILENGPIAVRYAIEAVYQSGKEAGFEKEAELFGSLCETEDFVEGTSAFLEKRKPDFKGK